MAPRLLEKKENLKIGLSSGSAGNNAIFTGKGNSLGLLDKFVPQEKRMEKRISVKQNAKIEKVKKAFEKYCLEKFEINSVCDDYYRESLKALGGRKLTAKEVEMFSLSLAEFEKYAQDKWHGAKIGYFLSALVNTGVGKEFVIHTDCLGTKIDGFGCHNRKRIMVIGDLGSGAGSRMMGGKMEIHGNVENSVGNVMKKGEIIVFGNAGGLAGEIMKGGKVEIRGNAGDMAGYEQLGGTLEILGNVGNFAGHVMTDGTLLIHGNTGHSVGENMAGGTIRVDGRIERLSNYIYLKGENTHDGNASIALGANIWHGKTQIVKDGKIIAQPINK